MDGPIKYWNDGERKFVRENNKIVSLKSFKKSSNLNEEFLNEIWN